MNNPVEVSYSSVEVYAEDGDLMVRFDLLTENGRRDAVQLATDLILQPVVVFRRDAKVRGLPGYPTDPDWAANLSLQILEAARSKRRST